MKDEPCDPDHYCTYVNWDEYAKIQVGGIGCTIACTAVTVSFAVEGARSSCMIMHGFVTAVTCVSERRD